MMQRRRRSTSRDSSAREAPKPQPPAPSLLLSSALARAHDRPRRRLLQLACLSRLGLLLYAVLADALLPDHDAEGALQLDVRGLSPYLRAFTRWDAAHFLSIAQHGRYPSLPSHAFFPLYPFLVRALANCLCVLSRPFAPAAATAVSSPSLATLVVAALLVTNISFLLATLALYELTLHVLLRTAGDGGGGGPPQPLREAPRRAMVTRGAAKREGQDAERGAFLAALLYVASPASIFYTTAYSEALYSALTFGGLFLTLDSRRLPRFALGCLLLAGAGATRSNGLLNALPLALHPSITTPLLSLLISLTDKKKKKVQGRRKTERRGLWSALSSSLPWAWAREVAVRGLGCLVLLAPYAALQYHGWRKFCTPSASPSASDPGPDPDLAWCHAKPFPSLYSHIQRQHWDVGFLRYWRWRQLPNFLLAAPVLAITAHGTRRYFMRLGARLWGGAGGGGGGGGPRDSELDSLGLLGYELQWLTLGAFALLVAHVQIATRLLGAACPALYWSLASRLLHGEAGKGGNGVGRVGRFAALYVAYCALFNVLGPLLHCNFLPWT